MKSNHFLNTNKTMVDNYLYKTTRTNALSLHKLYNLEKVHVPSAKEILIHLISLTKYFDDELKDVIEYTPNEDERIEHLAMCNFLDIDYDSIIPYDPSMKDLKF